MNMSFYTGAVGAYQQQQRMNVQSNNIANVNNYGFKAKRPVFSDLMYGYVQGAQQDEMPRGTGAYMVSADTDFHQSGFADTGRALDYAINGDGFFALWDPSSGEYTYTRDGSFTMSQYMLQNGEGELETRWYLSDGLGRFVMGTNGQLIEVDAQDSANMAKMLPVGIFDFVNTNGMLSLSENRFSPIEKNGNLRVGSGKLVQGKLEQSNADLANEISKVIESQRSFTYALKMIQTSDEIETTVNDLRR